MSHESALQDGEPLPPDTVVIRTGQSKIETMRKSVIRNNERLRSIGQPAENALSVEYRLGLDAAGISREAKTGAFRLIRQTTVARLEAAGFEVVHEGRLGHGKLKLGDPCTDDVLERVSDAFDPPEPNPVYGL